MLVDFTVLSVTAHWKTPISFDIIISDKIISLDVEW